MTESANKRLKLPRDKMKRIDIAFDVDGTLIKNVLAQDYLTKREFGIPYKYDVINPDIIELLKILAKFKNTRIIVWSAGGTEYAQKIVDGLMITKYVDVISGKHELGFKPDIAIDDIQDTALGLINLIVREK